LNIINDILDYSKIEAGKIDFELIDFDLRLTVKDAVNIISGKAYEKGLKFNYTIANDIPPFLKGDPRRLRQVLINLLGNSIKFTDMGKIELSISLHKEDDIKVVLYFAVTDTGVGITEELIDSIFTAFCQVNDTDTRMYGGTGLGLAISKKLVEIMGGHIGVNSIKNEGSTFYFTCVFEKQNTYSTRSLPPPEIGNITDEEKKKNRILLAEDNITNQKVTAGILEKNGYYLDVVSTGKEVLKALERRAYSLILMDVQMPDMNGFDATMAIREMEKNKNSHIPVIAMTAHAMEGYRTKCFDAGMDDYICKPFNINTLINTIEKHLLEKPVSDKPVEEEAGITGIFNKEVLFTRLEKDEKLFKRVLNVFVDDLPNKMQKLKKAFAMGDIDFMIEVAHSLKGAAANMTAEDLRIIALEIEENGKSENHDNLRNLINKLDKSAEELKLAVKDYL
jgi:CheY-like chemotaxis protein/HPt (histidine-containing phosphotransfer) domain-containing protein